VLRTIVTLGWETNVGSNSSCVMIGAVLDMVRDEEIDMLEILKLWEKSKNKWIKRKKNNWVLFENGIK
jgi:hypothetical protein